MKTEEFCALLGNVNEKYIREARAPRGAKRWYRRGWAKWGAAACLCLLLASIPLFGRGGEEIALSAASGGVTARYVESAPDVSSKADLVWLSEEELFTEWDTAIFKGTVTRIRNIRLDFDGEAAYRAVAEIAVEKVYRGDCAAGETVSILLPCPVSSGIWVEDTETASAMREGMTGIFMPMAYGADSVWQQNGATLALRDLAPYGLADGLRWVFLETEDGLLFAREAYESAAGAETLGEIEAYILQMLESLE